MLIISLNLHGESAPRKRPLFSLGTASFHSFFIEFFECDKLDENVRNFHFKVQILFLYNITHSMKTISINSEKCYFTGARIPSIYTVFSCGF